MNGFHGDVISLRIHHIPGFQLLCFHHRRFVVSDDEQPMIVSTLETTTVAERDLDQRRYILCDSNIVHDTCDYGTILTTGEDLKFFLIGFIQLFDRFPRSIDQ